MSPKPIHLIVGEDPADVQLLVGDFDLTKESFIASIKFEIVAGSPDHKKLTIEFTEFTAELAVSPCEVTGIVPVGELPKWMPDSPDNGNDFALAT